ncbi:N-terminal acetyltransferase [Pestalotiopsis sp. 9143b]|nr:N-terminal acetyltransferase [Pestalotiopsis sp. 9143b]
MADRPRFDKAQIDAYFARIALPDSERKYTVTDLSDEQQLAYLTLLQKHHLNTVPFENLTLHYSWHRVVDVGPRHLFDKIVGDGAGRGGYCMEVNSLLHTLLLSLGFRVFLAGARVYRPAPVASYGGFSHCVNIVKIGAANTKYMVDVGFGANGPSAPLPLDVGREHVQIAPAAVRLVREPIPQNADQDCKVWIYQHQIGPEASWEPMYCFVDFEFILEDIRGMNLSPWKSPTSTFIQRIMVTRFTAKGETEDNVHLGARANGLDLRDGFDGALIIYENKLKWRRDGETVLEKQLESDEERVAALKKYFHIHLSDKDAEAIRGTATQIK